MNKPLCAICHRPLRSAASIAAGVGPVCAGKQPKGKRHKIKFLNGSSHTHNNGATGEPLTTAQALAAVRRVAGIGSENDGQP